MNQFLIHLNVVNITNSSKTDRTYTLKKQKG